MEIAAGENLVAKHQRVVGGGVELDLENAARFGKGVAMEAQSNPIHLPTRPKAIVRLVDTLDD